MTGWLWIVAAAAVAFVVWAAFVRRWWHALWYSWTRARHLVDLTETEVIPGAEWGSMNYWDDPHGPEIVARVAAFGDIAGPPDGLTWDEQIAADLSPETLAGSFLPCAPTDISDSGPGDAGVLPSPGPAPNLGGGV